MGRRAHGRAFYTGVRFAGTGLSNWAALNEMGAKGFEYMRFVKGIRRIGLRTVDR